MANVKPMTPARIRQLTEVSPISEAAEKRLASIVGEVLNRRVLPTMQVLDRVRAAADETNDDAELGRRVRAIIREHAAAVMANVGEPRLARAISRS